MINTQLSPKRKESGVSPQNPHEEPSLTRVKKQVTPHERPSKTLVNPQKV